MERKITLDLMIYQTREIFRVNSLPMKGFLYCPVARSYETIRTCSDLFTTSESANSRLDTIFTWSPPPPPPPKIIGRRVETCPTLLIGPCGSWRHITLSYVSRIRCYTHPTTDFRVLLAFLRINCHKHQPNIFEMAIEFWICTYF